MRQRLDGRHTVPTTAQPAPSPPETPPAALSRPVSYQIKPTTVWLGDIFLSVPRRGPLE